MNPSLQGNGANSQCARYTFFLACTHRKPSQGFTPRFIGHEAPPCFKVGN